MKKITTIMLLIVILTACQPSNKQIREAIEKTQAAQAQVTNPINSEDTKTSPKEIPPTETAAITATPEPTNTPQPSSTPRPTNTPKPTDTPTPIPDPIEFSGSGDQIVDFDSPWGPAVIHVVNNGSGHFAVHNLDANNESIDLLVNTVGNYDGYRPIDWRAGEATVRFEVKSSGAWNITVYPLVLDYLHKCMVPSVCTGTGDDIMYLVGNPDILDFTYEGTSHVAVISYGANDIDLLINDIGPYTGQVLLPSDAVFLEIKSEGPWTADIKGR